MDASSLPPPSAPPISGGDTSPDVPSVFDCLPESSLVSILFFAIRCPQDICNLALVCKTWETATLSNVLWKSMLPPEYATLCAYATPGPIDTADLRTVFKRLLQGFPLHKGQALVKMEFQNYATLVYHVRMDETWQSQFCEVARNLPGSKFGTSIGLPSGIQWLARGEEVMLPVGEYSVSLRMTESRPKIVTYVTDWARYPKADCTYHGRLNDTVTDETKVQKTEQSEAGRSKGEKVDLSKVAYLPNWSELPLGSGTLASKGSAQLGYERASMHLEVHSASLLARYWMFDCLVYRKVRSDKSKA